MKPHCCYMWRNIQNMWILSLLLLWSTGVCLAQRACPGGCYCVTSSSSNIITSVTCNHAGFTSVPRAIPQSTMKLSLKGNKIKTITKDDFKTLKNLRNIELISNSIEQIQPGAFDGLGSLENINLFGNKLSTISKHTFKELVNINILDLESNNLTEIVDEAIFGCTIRHLNLDKNPRLRSLSRSAFQGSSVAEVSIRRANLSSSSLLSLRLLQSSLLHLTLTDNSQQLNIADDLFEGFKFKQLTLERNGIKSRYFLEFVKTDILSLSGNPIGPIAFFQFPLLANVIHLNLSSTEFGIFYHNLFDDLPKLKTLDMSRNEIRIISQELLRLIDQLDLLRLEKNPLHCNCRMHWLKNYTNTNPRKISGAKCIFPEQKDINLLPDNKFQCVSPYNITSPDYVSVAQHAEMSLACSASGDPAPKIIWRLISGGSVQVDSADPDAPGNNKGYVFVRNMTDVMYGIYECVAVNVAGELRAETNVTSAKYLTTARPTITVKTDYIEPTKISFISSTKASKLATISDTPVPVTNIKTSKNINITSEENMAKAENVTELISVSSSKSFTTFPSQTKVVKIPTKKVGVVAGRVQTSTPLPKVSRSTPRYKKTATPSKRNSKKISVNIYNRSNYISCSNLLFYVLCAISMTSVLENGIR